MLRLLAMLFGCVALICPAQAQTSSSSTPPDSHAPAANLTTGTNEFGFWGGYSPNSPHGIGITSDRKLFLLNGSYARVIGNTDSVAIKYTIDIVPVALITQPAETFVTNSGALISHNAETVYGGGLDPIGFQFNFRRGHKWQPFANTHGGFLYFAQQVPVIDSSQYNFTFSFGGGVQVFTSERSSFSIGYKYYHLSNANSGNRNPGVDANLFYAGFSFFK
ncbi:MAG TPA: acyloxyacyl hydrolase [Terriglobales bacterium]|nr:acyloxyacyl hydrolase [Terriglobales bacterium]